MQVPDLGGRTLEVEVLRRRGRTFVTCAITAALSLTLGAAGLAQAGRQGDTVGQPWIGQNGITETVNQIMAREAGLAPLRNLMPRPADPLVVENREGLPENPASPETSQWPVPVGGPQPIISGSFTRGAGKTGGRRTYNPQPVGVTFLGAQQSESPYVPPDSMGAVSPTQVLFCENGRIKVFSKAGVLGALNASTDTFFSSVLGGSSASDPRVRFDRLSQRWFITMINVTTPNRVMIAVSSGATITGSSSFTFFQFQQDLVGPTPNEDTGGFADYDTLGVDANALYIGVNEFESNGGFDTTGFVVNKADLLSNSLLVTAFRGLTGGQTAGPYTPQGVDNDDPAATQGYFIGVDIAQFGLLQLRRISTPGGTPTISGNIPLTVPSTTNPINVPSKGASIRLDAIDERLFLARINKDPNGVAHLWTAHSFEVNSSGVASSSGGRDGSRWYDITNLSSTPTLNQSGTLFDSSSVAPRNFWFPSITMSGQGHAALGSSVADTNEFADVAVAGRLFSDTLGAIQSPTTAVTSSFAYTANVTNPQRWGDYSNTVVDPADNMTFWSFQEWCVSTGNWGVQAIQLLAPPPAAPTSANPSTVTQGSSNVNVTITGTSSSGSGFYDPGAGFPNHISASVGGTGVTVNSVTYTDPTHVTLNISVASNASTGAQTVTITNPDGQSTTSASGILTIANSTAVSSVTLTPNSVIGPASSSGLVTLSATVSANTVVNLSSANSAATVPSTITVLSGTNSQTFNVTTSVVTTTTTGNITASLGSSSQSAGFTVNPDTVKSITFSSNPVTGGVKTTGTVTLNAAAPTGGIVVSISSSNTAVANPAVSSITILAGATTGKFTITTTAVSTKTAVTITATANGTPTTATLTVRTIPLASLTISPNSVVGGTSTTGTVTLTQNAAPGNIKVFLSSTNTAVAKPAVASVTILAGTKSATFTINTFTVASSTAVTIKAFADNTSKAATVTVTP